MDHQLCNEVLRYGMCCRKFELNVSFRYCTDFYVGFRQSITESIHSYGGLHIYITALMPLPSYRTQTKILSKIFKNMLICWPFMSIIVSFHIIWSYKMMSEGWQNQTRLTSQHFFNGFITYFTISNFDGYNLYIYNISE